MLEIIVYFNINLGGQLVSKSASFHVNVGPSSLSVGSWSRSTASTECWLGHCVVSPQ